ncbi:MAG TPA: hypothetical protein DG754_05110, partial [Bacteroidales bacterium]|nr:hypothetical protein [Bacteroidales bacterium]
EKVKGKTFPSFLEIKECLSQEGFQISDRTVQRDFEQIRLEFGVEISYNRLKNGYYIDSEKSINVESFIRFLELVNTANIITESLHDSKKTLEYISFDGEGGLVGIENLKPLLKAVRENIVVAFDHFSFQKNSTKHYQIQPYLLKEYQNRWYVFGIVEGLGDFRTFGIDRIENLMLTAEKFVRDDGLNPLEKFKNTIGLVYSNSTIQRVVLSFTPQQGKYIQTLPLHTSQQVLIDNDKETRISIDVIPNYELTQHILKHGDRVKVIEPEWLVDEIKEILHTNLKQY